MIVESSAPLMMSRVSAPLDYAADAGSTANCALIPDVKTG
jgi:hypothetical protein